MTIDYHEDAVAESLDAAAWYESRQEELATRFLTKWKEAERSMVADPERNRPFQGSYRQCRFEVFPFALVYRILPGETLQVIAVMHQSRAPGYWSKRV